MAAHTPCAECGTANRTGLLFCVVCGRRLPESGYPLDRVTALAWPGPEVRAVSAAQRTSALGWASLFAALLGWTVLPMVGAAVGVLLALRALEASGGEEAPRPVIRLALWLGGVQLVLGFLAVAAMGVVGFVALCRAG
jgi:hypothetical protein